MVQVAFSTFKPVARQKNSRSFKPLLLQYFGRHDWIRTNDPHHVKVML